MKDLKVADVAPIYEKNYWGRCKCDSLPKSLDLCVFDFGVNAETKGVISIYKKWLVQLLTNS